jgi:hypothetical protein
MVAKRTGVVSSGLVGHSQIWPFLLPVLQSLAHAPIIAGAFVYMRGQEVRTADALLTFVRRIGPVASVSIVQTMAFMIGLALLVVPGIVAWTTLFVALPACIGEQGGIMDSLKRSAALSKGHRWKILGLGLVMAVMGLIPTMIVQQIAFRLGGSTGFSIAEYLLQVVFVPFNATISVTVYQALRTAKEGPATGTLSEVFA